ncbi:MAG: DUF4982 domain-containing protein [Solobacterium sp.]|nr:DUF4982 domain-containing protein [Solobacterium sp.]
MKRMLRFFMMSLVLMLSVLMPVSAEEEGGVFHAEGRSTCIDEDWEFQLNGGEWEDIDLPHDWSIKEAFSTDCEAESGFLPGGTGIYRKTLIIPEEYAGKRFVIEFGGVYMDAEVSVNGKTLGSHPYGYTPFAFDLSEYLIKDGRTENTIEVSVNHTVPSSRWYSGSGIYRSVYLTVTEPEHIAYQGMKITTPKLEQGSFETTAEVTVQNDSDQEEDITVSHTILSQEGDILGKASEEVHLSAQASKVSELSIPVEQAELWSLENPSQYICRTELTRNGSLLDSLDTRFGYRWTAFDADHGFFLNGQSVKLKGVCLHHDQGALGAAAYPAAIDRQLDKLQAMGVNAIRTAHNPADSHLLEECSKRGILVIEEAFDTWLIPKNGNDYDYSRYFLEDIKEGNEILNGEPGLYWSAFDARAMVLHSRNEPCVILYSIGNELLGNIEGDTSQYPKYAEMLSEWISRYDDRPVTIADNMTLKDNAIQEGIDTAVHEAGGVVGLNYATAASMDRYHEEHPDWKLYGSETVSTYGSRGEYSTDGIDETTREITAFDRESVEWGMEAAEAWKLTIERDYIAGEFVWTGFDYLGEPEPWNGISPGSVTDGTPSPHSSCFGILDTAGFPKDAYYLYQSLWRDDLSVVHILPDWNPENLRTDLFGKTDVAVYTNAASVELFLNGKSLGRKTAEVHTTEDGHTYRLYDGKLYPSWKVKYSAGTLYAIAYDEAGNVIEAESGRDRVQTPEAASRIILEADGGDDTLLYYTVTLKDVHGNTVSTEDREIRFELEGDGILLASDNGDPNDLRGYQETSSNGMIRDTYHGKALVIVQRTGEGEIRLKASAEGLPSASLTVTKPSESVLDRIIETIREEAKK